MPNLKEVKSRIASVISTQQITKAMKMVAASKLRRAQDKMLHIRPYAERLNDILGSISQGKSDDHINEFQLKRDVKKILIIVVTSDRGLCGAFNSNIYKAVATHIQNKYNKAHSSSEGEGRGEITLMCIGKKGWDYFSKSMSRALARERVEIVGDYVKLFSNLDFIEVKKATDHILNGFLNDDFQIVDIIYNEFKNVAAQIIRTEQFLPIVENSLPHTIKGVDGKQESGQANKTNPEVDYIFEPSRKQIMNALIPYSLRIRFYKALLESNAAEHGARMTAMDQATDNAEEILSDLRLTYNRTRQAAITKEILEIVGGAEALQGGG